MVDPGVIVDRAVIFDRDGTLNEDNGYTHKSVRLKMETWCNRFNKVSK